MSIHEAAQAKLNEAIESGEVEVNAGESAVTPTATDAEVQVAVDPAAVVVEETVVAAEPTVEDVAAAEEAADAAEADLADDATAEEIEAARAAATEEFYAGSYRTREDAEAGIAEKDATLERLFSERNVLEQQLREAQESATVAEQEPTQIDLPAWDQWASDQVDQGAGQAGAIQAMTEGGMAGYQVYLRHWIDSEREGDRSAAIIFNNDVTMEMAEMRAAAAVRAERERPSAAELQEEAVQHVLTRRPDLEEYTEEMGRIVAELPHDDRQFLQDLAASGVQGRAKALEMVYLEAKSRGGAKAQQAREVEKTRRRVSGDAARLQATTSSSEAVNARTPPPASELIGLDRKRGLRERQSLPPLDE